MPRPFRTYAAVLGTAGLLALTGCGKERPAESAPGQPTASAASGQPSASASSALPSRPAEPELPAALRKIHEACEKDPAPEPTASPTPFVDGSDGTKYAENHGFQRPSRLTGAQLCEGEANSRRIVAALRALDRPSPESVRRTLADLGYPAERLTIPTGAATDYVPFTLDLSGLCLDGVAGSGVPRAEPHGRYIEGTGCEKPVGGH
ncbi:hypothetical protein [Streptomyces sp. NBC_01304]|uniref:hypothetical protein n=1 Tax=Streptomyces sp. NBC_01304 TaxID=2903818 RepID=UPI002E16074D|nr:hypothetical protein OG430_10105 [Streptomyces sp. NBC_01304]